MKRRLFIFLLSFATVAQAQHILLLAEDFELTSNTFAFDTGTTGPWITSGPNRWIINNEYDGGGIYPNTTRQDSASAGIIIGTINRAPFSRYLHIHDEAAVASGVSNANYNPTIASDRFAYIRQGYCTKGLTDVILAFFYISDGSPTAYGEVYYSINGGAWTKTGATQYRSTLKWEYVEITDPVFADVDDLRFGFRWVNNAGSPPGTVSFSLDEVFVVASYDVLNGAQLSVSSVTPNPVCQQNVTSVTMMLSKALCDGQYDFELSNDTGSFANPVNLGFINSNLPSGINISIGGVQIPASTPPGTCYKIRVNRVTPPLITGIESPCFTVIECPNNIETQEALVTTDPDTVCAKSAIDIPFLSYGVYGSNNYYTAQLSDANGNFTVNDTTILPPDSVFIPPDTLYNPIDTTLVIDTTVLPHDTSEVISYDTVAIPGDTIVTVDTIFTTRDVFTVINSKADDVTYDPAFNPNTPGMVSGLVPEVPEGCNYYIRIVASDPPTIGTLSPRFCIKHCDITTNKTIDLHYCITDTTGVVDTIFVDINEWDTAANYAPGNQFIVQLISMMPPFTIVNTGGLGAEIKDSSGTMAITIPNHIDLAALGIMPGVYYMRLIANGSSTPWNMNGTIIRITIGAPADNPSRLVPDKTQYCSNEIASFVVTPYNPQSQYQVLSQTLNNGSPLNLSGPFLNVIFPGLTEPFEFSVRVREINYGCFGLYSPLTKVLVLVEPDVNITGQREICKGDTFTYSVPFFALTFYSWTLDWGTIVDTANNQITVVFDSVGANAIHIYAVNECGIRTNTLPIDVFSIVDVDAGTDTAICEGESVTLSATNEGFKRTLTTGLDTSAFKRNGNMFNLQAIDEVIIQSFDVNLAHSAGTFADISIYYKTSTYVGSEYISSDWRLVGSAANVLSNGPGNPTPVPVPVNITIPAGSTFGFYITTTNGTNFYSSLGPPNPVARDGSLEVYKGTACNYPFGAPASAGRIWSGRIHYRTFSGINYLWNTADETADITITPDSTALYSVYVSDSNGCGDGDEVMVTLNPNPIVDAGLDDTVCLGKEAQLAATGADIYLWTPENGLSDPNSSNPVLTPSGTQAYLLTGTDSATGCMNYDTVTISIGGCEIVIPQAFTPNNDGSNDYFTVFGDNFDTYEIRIFNRWGEQVYYSDNVDELSQGDLTKGWNGTHNGKPQDLGVYVYYIKAGIGSAPPVERKGNVTLIR